MKLHRETDTHKVKKIHGPRGGQGFKSEEQVANSVIVFKFLEFVRE